MRIILHIDMDAFFAAIEERDKPWLKGKPIVVGADPSSPAGEGKGRGVVSTANYKAREYGIHSAQPISEAWRLSEAAAQKGQPRAEFLTGSYERYSEVSRVIMEYLRTQGDVFEPGGIDEAYLELQSQPTTHNLQQQWKEAEEKAQEIKRYIKRNFKLTCSIGIGPNKLIAKIAAGVKKPDGLTVVKPDEVQEFLDPMPARALPGIGPKSEEVLKRAGIKTVKDIRLRPEAELAELFGKWGHEMWRKAQGIDESPVVEEYEVKSIGEQETFPEDTLDASFLTGRLKTMAQSVERSLKKGGFRFKTVSLIVRFADFETKTRAHTLKSFAQDAKTIEQEALALFLPFLDQRENPKKKFIRLLGVRVDVEKLSTV